MAIPSNVLTLAVDLARRHNAIASAEWVMQWFGVMTFGTEYIRFDETDERIEYVNRGDTYHDTVYYDESLGDYCIGSWGDWLCAIEEGYAESTGKYNCPNCGSWSDDNAECDQCGYNF
jgi:hypothetical protein